MDRFLVSKLRELFEAIVDEKIESAFGRDSGIETLRRMELDKEIKEILDANS